MGLVLAIRRPRNTRAQVVEARQAADEIRASCSWGQKHFSASLGQAIVQFFILIPHEKLVVEPDRVKDLASKDSDNRRPLRTLHSSDADAWHSRFQPGATSPQYCWSNTDLFVRIHQRRGYLMFFDNPKVVSIKQSYSIEQVTTQPGPRGKYFSDR